jgi:UDP-2,3-diacylglucosamine pyrophosphatase LpxH
MKKIKLVISDFHLSRGNWLPDGRRNPLEDFHQDDRFREFLEHYSTGAYADADVELIVNGDFFDPLAVMPPDVSLHELRKIEFPADVEETAAVHQMEIILRGHPVVVNAIKAFLSYGKKVTFRWGNHDAFILWPEVQKYLRTQLSPPSPEQIGFQDKPYLFDKICIDHGHQYEASNHFDEERIFIERQTRTGKKRILSLPFGSFFVLGFLNRVKLERKFINQVQPFRKYLKYALIFEPLFFLTNGVRATWFFLKMRLITHPMRFARFNKTLQIIYEIFSPVDLEEEAEKLLANEFGGAPEFDTLILGHNHRATVRIFKNGKQYINTGTWIPLTSLEMDSLGHRVLRTYAHIEYIDGKPQATLRVWNGSPQISEEMA